MPQRIQRITLHRSTHPKWEQDKREKSSYSLDWLQKGIWYGSTKLDNTLSQNVQNITWSHKLHRKNHANLESGTDSRRKKLSWNKDPKRDFQGDALSPLLFIIAMMPLNHILSKCIAGYKLSRSQEKINHLMYIDDIKLFAKNEKELETPILAVRVYSQDIGMEFSIEKCTMLVMKSGKWHMTDGMELPNHDKIRTLGENETYKYLGILKADTIKQVEMKDKIRKLKKLWNMNVTVVPIVVVALCTVTKGFLKGLEDLEIRSQVEIIQTTALLRSVRILWRVLETWGDLWSFKISWKTIC